jgi:hypothetical protein
LQVDEPKFAGSSGKLIFSAAAAKAARTVAGSRWAGGSDMDTATRRSRLSRRALIIGSRIAPALF